jgi:hypothetical protein
MYWLISTSQVRFCPTAIRRFRPHSVLNPTYGQYSGESFFRIVSVLVIYPARKQIGVGAPDSNQICFFEIMDTARFEVETPLIDFVFLLLVGIYLS